MSFLSNAFAKGRRYTAGCTKLAVFFLCCLPFFTACPLNASGGDSGAFPYVVNGKLCSFTPDSQEEIADGYTQGSVAPSKKDGYILAWNQKKQRLYHFAGQKAVSNLELKASFVYTGADYLLAQSSSFADNKGFSFTLYSIKYSSNKRKIKLRSIWTGYIDCFVADFFFTEDGICIAGGTRDDEKNNVFYITGKGIHKSFSTKKESDFLRLIQTSDLQKAIAFVSTRDKSDREAIIYSFDINKAPEEAEEINLSKDPLLPADFNCFFGYGFAIPPVHPAGSAISAVPVVPELVEGVEGAEMVILPASLNGIINFICYDLAAGKITAIIPDAVGCVAALSTTPEGTYYIARDPLLEASWYGIALFTGTECKKIKEF